MVHRNQAVTKSSLWSVLTDDKTHIDGLLLYLQATSLKYELQQVLLKHNFPAPTSTITMKRSKRRRVSLPISQYYTEINHQ